MRRLTLALLALAWACTDTPGPVEVPGDGLG